MNTVRTHLRFVLPILGLFACVGTESGASDSEDTGAALDTGAGGTDTDDGSVDARDVGDARLDGDGGGGDRAAFGEPCVEDSDCARNLCLYLEAGLDEGFCSSYCFAGSDCPDDGWDCIFLANSGVDAAFLCAPDDLCLDRDDDGFGVGPGCSGPDCDDANRTVHLGADEICDGIDNDCDGLVDDNSVEAGVSCVTAFPGACSAGVQRCTEGLLECEPLQRATQEFCDGVDNDCDGLIDEGPDGGPLTQSCYGGASSTLGVGQCAAGTRTCVEGVVGDCVGQVLPLPETCDGLDNDCDGEADEGQPESGVACETDRPGICRAGVTRCTEEGIVCVALEPPRAEVCDGRDNDCDGLIDEGEDGAALTRECYSGPSGTRDVGACQGGTQSCSGAEWGRCEGEVLPSLELCSTEDEDCDGVVNNGDPAGGLRCETGGFGLCAYGRTACGVGTTQCIPDYAPVAETCDGFDNDCDDAVDEGPTGAPLSRTCYDGPASTRGRGECRDGAQTCAGGDWGGCVDQRMPAFELCDGRDNDCDGLTDEGDPGGGIACTTGRPGACAAGVTACVDGEVACRQTGTQSAEVCDGLDNDCDGLVDEDATWSDLGSVCFAGQGVCRAAGVRTCNPVDPAGATVCSAVVGTPGTEVCDGLDNDCDGLTDEAFPDLGRACTAGLGVCRASGVNVCDGPGAVACDAVVPAPPGANETACDYLDDDCDGQVDEDYRTGAVYDRVDNCGGCGVSCAGLWPGGPAAYNVAPKCDVFMMVARCAYDCLPGFYDLDLDPANGCEFTPDSGAVYVSTAERGGSNAASCGNFTAPCATITYGIGRAQALGRPRVRVSDGLFSETVTLADGVSVLGGHNATNWVRNPSLYVSFVSGANTGLDNAGVIASGITTATELSGFTIQAASGRVGGGNSTGIAIWNSNQNLVVRNNRVFAGNGGLGSSGSTGSSGLNGVAPSASGLNSTTQSNCGGLPRAGATGGARTCQDPGAATTTNVSGGNGGQTNCPSPGVQNGAGAAGVGPGGPSGSGGAGGAHMYGSTSGCQVSTGTVIDASPGSAGASGSDGSGGGGASGSGGASTMQWRGAGGASGGHGQHGGGGGGGGAAAGVDGWFWYSTYWIGASGGGGGSGGCAGTAGSGGSAGGGSFAITVGWTGTPPASSAVMPQITGNVLARGNGGNGGSGGNGGAGGDPGAGSSGGLGVNSGTLGFCMLKAGNGGAGGRGGHGGGGGGGAGGHSLDILVWNSGTATNTYHASNSFLVSGGTNTGGSGGPGGTSANTTRVGGAGAAGQFGNVLRLP